MQCLSRCFSRVLGYGGWASHSLTNDNEKTNEQSRVAAQGQAALRTTAEPGSRANAEIPEKREEKRELVVRAVPTKRESVVAALPVEGGYSDKILSPAIKCRVDEIAKKRKHKDEQGLGEFQQFIVYDVGTRTIDFDRTYIRSSRPSNYPILPNEVIASNWFSSQLYNKIEKIGKTLIFVERAHNFGKIELTTQNAKDIVAEDPNRVVVWGNSKIIYCHHAGLMEPIAIRFPYTTYLQLEVLVELIAKEVNIDDQDACREAIAKAEAEEKEFNSNENRVKRQQELRSEIIAEVIAEEEAFRAKQGIQGLRHRVSHAAAGAGAGPGPGNSTALVISHTADVWAS